MFRRWNIKTSACLSCFSKMNGNFFSQSRFFPGINCNHLNCFHVYLHLFLASVSCPTRQFECHDRKQCISKSKKCDGVEDCNDGSDESDCGMLRKILQIWWKAYSEICRTSKMEHFAKIGSSFKPLTIFTKYSILTYLSELWIRIWRYRLCRKNRNKLAKKYQLPGICGR